MRSPLRGAAAFESTAGLNAASDALSNRASGGVAGGALIILGEDDGEGSSIMQERSRAIAEKGPVRLLDPRPNLRSIVKAVGDGFALCEASNTPLIPQLRIRGRHVIGACERRDNRRPPRTAQAAQAGPRRDTGRIVLPPASYRHEREKIETLRPAVEAFIRGGV